MLEGSQQLVLYSLNPLPSPPDDKLAFHGHAVLGQTPVTGLEPRSELLHSLYEGIRRSSDAVPACFNPRHGIRAVVGSQAVDLVICFQCMQIEVYEGGVKRLITTTRTPQPQFDRALKDAGVPFPDR